MSGLRLALGAALLLLAGAAGAQPVRGADAGGPTTAPPDVPRGEASILGRIVHPERPGARAGVEVVLYALPPSGVPGVRSGVSDAEGRFRFDGISADPGTAYLVGARYEGVPYPGGRVQFAAGERQQQVTVRIADVTPLARGVAVAELLMRVDWLGGTLRVTETLALENPGTRTVYVPEADRAAARPALGVELPAGADDFRTPLGIMPDGLVREGRRLRYFGPIYPGSQELAYSYSLPAGAGELELARRLPTALARVVVLAPASGLAVKAPGLEAGDEQALQGQTYRRYEGGPRPAGSALRLALTVPAARTDPAALSVAEARLYLELDGAALLAREEHLLRVDGDTPVLGEGGEPLLRIPLPEGAIDVRFGVSVPGVALDADPAGGLAVLGPVPPGESTLELTYRVPAGEDGAVLTLARRFPRRVPLLSVYTADTGRLLATSERLHRRRPVRSADRSYIHLEGFELEAGEEIVLRLAPLPAQGGLPRPAVLGFFALATLASLGVLLGPLRGRAGETPAAEEETAARQEREALYAAIRDLDHDHETQKIADADYHDMRRDLRSRAVALLRAEQEQEQRGEAAPVEPVCRSCAAALQASDRFCSQCGTPTAGQTEREARG